MADVPSFPALLCDLDAITLPSNTNDTGSGNGRSQIPMQRAVSGSTPGPHAAPGSYVISSYGISATTLEEVFLRVTQAASATSVTDKQVVAVTQSLNAGVTSSHDSHTVSMTGYQSSEDSNKQALQGKASAAVHSQVQGGSEALHTPAPPGTDHVPRLTGLCLIRQQLRALLVKRALCASRDRLALLTQLLVPLALVTLSLWVSSLSIKSGNERPLVLSRFTALMGAPSVLAAATSVREQPDNLAAWVSAFPAPVVDSGVNDTWQGGTVPGTLEVGSWAVGGRVVTSGSTVHGMTPKGKLLPD
jgi:hypothetical protein